MRQQALQNKLLAILGGSFNPPHLGHLRIALETLGTLQPARLDLLPVYRPAHKKEGTLLPFELRCAMLRCFEDYDVRVRINTLESERPGKSYTFETLHLYRERYPDFAPVFLLGGEDFAQLQTWEGWEEFPALSHFLIIERGQNGREFFAANVRKFWPGSEALELRQGGGVLSSGASKLADKADAAFRAPSGGELWHLPMPRLDISATQLRQSWLLGENINGLLLEQTLSLLRRHALSVRNIWKTLDNGV